MLNIIVEDSFANHATMVLANFLIQQLGFNSRLRILKELMSETSMQKLRKMSTDLGSPGVEALWKASRKAALDVAKAEVQEVVRSRASKHFFEVSAK